MHTKCAVSPCASTPFLSIALHPLPTNRALPLPLPLTSAPTHVPLQFAAFLFYKSEVDAREVGFCEYLCKPARGSRSRDRTAALNLTSQGFIRAETLPSIALSLLSCTAADGRRSPVTLLLTARRPRDGSAAKRFWTRLRHVLVGTAPGGRCEGD